VLGIEHLRSGGGRMRASALLPRVRRPPRSSVVFALKAAVAAVLAIWLGDRLGLKDSYWAGISAVVATAGTLGASLGAAISRISATVVGLLVGLAAFALPVSGTIVAGAAVFVALVVLYALSLDAGARLGAATTLIVTAIPGQNAVGDALARGANVPLGCAVAVVVGLVLLPDRAADRLRAALRADIESAGLLVRSALLGYLGARPTDDLKKRLEGLLAANSAHLAELRDAGRESRRGEPVLRLEGDVATARALVEQVESVVRVVAQPVTDQAPSLIGSELEHVAETFADAASAVASDSDAPKHRILALDAALADVDAAFAAARERRGTVNFSTEELARLLSIIRCLHGAASALSRLAAHRRTA
jgi:uncharacterized membrane protein YgaE (UPF0421/DUF939 family)